MIKNEFEHIQLLKLVIARLRIYIQTYQGISKKELIEQLSIRMNIDKSLLHLDKLNDYNTICDVINTLKQWKNDLCGSRSIKPHVNIRQLARKQRGDRKMKVVEIFNSIDGEGIRAGELTTFIRLYGCNLRCSYCDSRYACEKTEENLPYTEMSISNIIKQCDKYDTNNITLTGGEPLIHEDVCYLLQALSEAGYDVNVETNGAVDISEYFDAYGYILPKYSNVFFTIDYKCPSSDMERFMLPDNFDIGKQGYSNIVYKFVVGSIEDLDVARKLITEHIIPDSVDLNKTNYVYLSPVFGKIEPKEIVEYMQKYSLYNSKVKVRIQLQLHKFIWDPDKRGV